MKDETHLGVIMKLYQDTAVVLTECCNFYMIRKLPYMVVGQEIRFHKKEIYISKKKTAAYFVFVTAAAVSVSIPLFFSSVFVKDNKYAYIEVDVNQSVEFCIDKDGNVIDAKPLGEDAKKLTGGLREVKIKDAVETVIRRAMESNDKKSNFVMISGALDDDYLKKSGNIQTEKQNFKMLLGKVGKDVTSKRNDNIVADVISIDSEERKIAIKNDISMTKYFLYEKAKEKGIKLTLEDVKGENTSDIISKIDIIPSEKVQDLAHADVNEINRAEVKSAGNVKKDNNKAGSDHADEGLSSVNSGTADSKGSEEYYLDNGNEMPEVKDKKTDESSGTDITPKKIDELLGGGKDSNKVPRSANVKTKQYNEIKPPGSVQLSSDHQGRNDGNYTLTMNMWFGANATVWKLYENNTLIHTGALLDNTPNSQTGSFKLSNKPKGTYVYECELVNSSGVTRSNKVTVIVEGPGTPVLMYYNSKETGDYKIIMKMWYGNNGETWKLYENNVLVYEGKLVDNTPEIQSASVEFKGKPKGKYTYRCDLIKGNDVTTSKDIEVEVK
ncbi:MAG TPA: anti-sigma factor domain-containing protein [Clostridia bacterium]